MLLSVCEEKGRPAQGCGALFVDKWSCGTNCRRNRATVGSESASPSGRAYSLQIAQLDIAITGRFGPRISGVLQSAFGDGLTEPIAPLAGYSLFTPRCRQPDQPSTRPDQAIYRPPAARTRKNTRRCCSLSPLRGRGSLHARTRPASGLLAACAKHVFGKGCY
ncbi:MAG: hypothetical protein ACI9LT_003581, partial [Pseudoalteromonas distincta]